VEPALASWSDDEEKQEYQVLLALPDGPAQQEHQCSTAPEQDSGILHVEEPAEPHIPRRARAEDKGYRRKDEIAPHGSRGKTGQRQSSRGKTWRPPRQAQRKGEEIEEKGKSPQLCHLHIMLDLFELGYNSMVAYLPRNLCSGQLNTANALAIQFQDDNFPIFPLQSFV
jgi:hypothetical protein